MPDASPLVSYIGRIGSDVTVVLQCIVRTYLQWLQDSDYKSICALCNGSLQQGDVVRLICYGT